MHRSRRSGPLRSSWLACGSLGGCPSGTGHVPTRRAPQYPGWCAQRPAHQRRRHRGRGAADAAARARALADVRARRDRARRQPLGDGALDHDAAAAVGHRGRRSATASVGYATDGTPVDCVRLANLGLIEGFQADLVVSGINHGANLGDDITYSGTVAAALEGIVLGIPAIAVSQQSRARRARLDRRRHASTSSSPAAFVARLVDAARALAAAAGDAAQRQRPRRARRPASRSPTSASASTATSCALEAEEERPPALLGLRHRARLRGRARAPTSPRSRAGASR